MLKIKNGYFKESSSLLDYKNLKEIAIIGKGAVGTTVAHQLKRIGVDRFDQFDSKTISQAFDKAYDLVIYAGVRATKYIAERDPMEDKAHCDEALDQLSRLKADRIVLISTIDASLAGFEWLETMQMTSVYGKHRLHLEFMASKFFKNTTTDFRILRLPALYGTYVKKNQWFNIVKGVDRIKLDDTTSKLVDSIKEDYRFDLKSMHSILDDTLDVNILSTINGHSTFVWFNLDDVLIAIEKLFNSKCDLMLAISKSDENPTGMLFSHDYMLHKMNERVYSPSNIKKVDYVKLIDSGDFSDSRSTLIKTDVDIFDKKWKEVHSS